MTTHDVNFNLPPGITSGVNSAASKILALIEEAYQEMLEKTFRSLRRTLPMTRSRLDWDKVCPWFIDLVTRSLKFD